MKIGLLTYYNKNNFGLFWQAVSTLKSLENADKDITVYLLPIERNPLHCLHGISKYPSALFPSSKRALKYSRARNRNLHGYIPIQGSIKRYDSPKLRETCNHLGLDLLLTGADTCLDMSTEAAQNNLISSYWLPDEITQVKGFLSSSCGGLTPEMLSISTINNLRTRIDSLAYCYVRDRLTFDLLRFISPACEPIFSPDPAYSVFSAYKNKADRPDSAAKPICVLSCQPTTFSLRIASLLENTHKLISLNRRSMTRNMSTRFPGPHDQLDLISKADLIVTTSFHETMAAAAMGTAYIAIERPVTIGRKFGLTKISDLCIRLGSPERYLDPANPIFADTDQFKRSILGVTGLTLSQRNSYRNICTKLGQDFKSVCSRIVVDAQSRI